MKILVVGHDEPSRQEMAIKIKEHYPDAVLVFSEDLPNPEIGLSTDGVWFDELSELRLRCPCRADRRGFLLKRLPETRSKVYPWSRRKKR